MIMIKCRKCGSISYSSYDGAKCACGGVSEDAEEKAVTNTLPLKGEKNIGIFFGEVLALINMILI
ncbi:MAG: hypothetical protein HQL30_02935 [Candidatus Omnitrophica bacterium]|nr:hypothetical protein [Candidatus Omnitrophota bacterium]